MKKILICLSLMLLSNPLLAEVSISYTVPKDSRVSLAVYDKEGRMVRTLLTGKPLAKGKHASTWDGLDRYGNPMPAGDCVWKLIATGKLAKRTKTSNRLGLDLGPGSGDAIVIIDELKIFGHALAETKVIRLSD
jgi:flagellar hook assembly protein FlgD